LLRATIIHIWQGEFETKSDYFLCSNGFMSGECRSYPVSLEMTFVPPHPFAFNMPENHSIKGVSITDVYVKVVKFFNKFGIEFRN
jgi:hypothetical protein